MTQAQGTLFFTQVDEHSVYPNIDPEKLNEFFLELKKALKRYKKLGFNLTEQDLINLQGEISLSKNVQESKAEECEIYEPDEKIINSAIGLTQKILEENIHSLNKSGCFILTLPVIDLAVWVTWGIVAINSSQPLAFLFPIPILVTFVLFFVGCSLLDGRTNWEKPMIDLMTYGKTILNQHKETLGSINATEKSVAKGSIYKPD